MLGEDIRTRRIRLQQKKDAAELKSRPSALDCREFHGVDETPPWVYEARREMNRAASSPDASASAENDVALWIERLVIENVTGRFFLGTGIEHFPWLDCQVRESGWAAQVVRVLGADLMFVSHDRKTFISFYEEEYETLFFRATRPNQA